MFIVRNDTGEVQLDPINTKLRIRVLPLRVGEAVRLSASEAHTLASALLSFSERNSLSDVNSDDD